VTTCVDTITNKNDNESTFVDVNINEHENEKAKQMHEPKVEKMEEGTQLQTAIEEPVLEQTEKALKPQLEQDQEQDKIKLRKTQIVNIKDINKQKNKLRKLKNQNKNDNNTKENDNNDKCNDFCLVKSKEFLRLKEEKKKKKNSYLIKKFFHLNNF